MPSWVMESPWFMDLPEKMRSTPRVSSIKEGLRSPTKEGRPSMDLGSPTRKRRPSPGPSLRSGTESRGWTCKNSMPSRSKTAERARYANLEEDWQARGRELVEMVHAADVEIMKRGAVIEEREQRLIEERESLAAERESLEAERERL